MINCTLSLFNKSIWDLNYVEFINKLYLWARFLNFVHKCKPLNEVDNIEMTFLVKSALLALFLILVQFYISSFHLHHML